MADNLNKSLDQIISENSKKNFKNKSGQKGNFRPKAKVVRSSDHAGKHNGNKKFQEKRFLSREDDEEENNAGFRPMKVVTLERPKVITPGSTVFNRLGQTGPCVVFHNLKRTVEEADVRELCRAIGTVKEIKYSFDHSIHAGTAKVWFANLSDAEACVTKYNGLALDNQEMHVSIEVDSNTKKQKSIFERIQEKKKATNNQKGSSFIIQAGRDNHSDSNVRSGLFGTALGGKAAMDGDDEDGGNTIDFGAGQKISVNLGGGGRVVHNDGNHPHQQGYRKVVQQQHGGRGGGRFNNKRNNNNQQPRAPKNKHMNAEDLDDELDNYMNDR